MPAPVENGKPPTPLSFSSGEPAMDVVVTRAALKFDTWTLSDRLGRPLGDIYQSSNGQIIIHANPRSALSGIAAGPYASLDDAMSSIATRMKGECQLTSGDEG